MLKNKIIAIALLLIGILSMLLDRDGTFFVMTLVLAIGLFTSKQGWII